VKTGEEEHNLSHRACCTTFPVAVNCKWIALELCPVQIARQDVGWRMLPLFTHVAVFQSGMSSAQNLASYLGRTTRVKQSQDMLQVTTRRRCYREGLPAEPIPAPHTT
jgi:hypothetical protein